MLAQDLRLTWLGKHSVFWWPLAPLMRWLGGVPVRRGTGAGTVDQTITLLRERERILVALAPEGTRSHVERWRRGFSLIAAGAGVPVIPVGLDWGRRSVKLGAPVAMSGDPEADEATLRGFFADTRAKRPSHTHH
jgi:1-acyl-sn-glycerol-3-phosphate acyltransferase